MSSETLPQKSKRQSRRVKIVPSYKAASTQPEELSPERRAEIVLELAAKEQRRRPP